MEYKEVQENSASLSAQVEQAVAALAIPFSDNLKVIPRDTANVSVVQLEVSHFSTIEDFVGTFNDIVAQAVNQRAHIVCFPALTAWLALPLSSRFPRLLPALQEHLATGSVNPHIVSDMLSACSSEMMEIYVSTMSRLAKHHGIYIMAGTSLYYEMHQAYHRAFLFDQFGGTAGLQDKLLPSFLEKLFQVEPGGEVAVFETPFGTLSMLPTTDVNTYEPVRIAKNSGADLILCPDIFIGRQTPIDAADGLNLRVMENNIYGVQPTLVGSTGLGFSLGKQSSVYAPPELTLAPGTDSTLMTSGSQQGTRLFTVSLEYHLLEERPNRLTQDKNPAFLTENFRSLY